MQPPVLVAHLFSGIRSVLIEMKSCDLLGPHLTEAQYIVDDGLLPGCESRYERHVSIVPLRLGGFEQVGSSLAVGANGYRDAGGKAGAHAGVSRRPIGGRVAARELL
jgi:hypothetical protein